MFSQERDGYNKSITAEFIAKEGYFKNRTSTKVFTEIILSEHRKDCKNGKNVWTQKQQSNIIKLPTVKS